MTARRGACDTAAMPPRALLLGALVLWTALASWLVWPIPWLWDDLRFLAEGPGADPWGALPRLWTTDYWALSGNPHASGMYRPILVLTFVLDGFAGPHPGLAHLGNVLIHLGTVAGVAALARRAGDPPWAAAGLVLVHPHVAELLGIVTNRSDALATALIVGSLVARGRRDGLADVLLLLACGVKELAYAAPALGWLEARRRGEARLGRDLLRPAAVVAAAVLLRVAVVGLGEGGRAAGVDPLAALANTGWVFLDIAAPVPAGPWPAPHPAWPGWVALVGLVLAARWAWHPLVWGAAASALVVGWLPFEVRPARGFLYLPLVGVALAAGAAVGRSGPLLRGAWAALLVGFAALQLAQLPVYRDPLAFWTWAVERHPDGLVPLLQRSAHQVPVDPSAAEAGYRRAAGLAIAAQDGYHFREAAMALARLALARGDVPAARAYLQDVVDVVGEADGAEAAALLATLPAE